MGNSAMHAHVQFFFFFFATFASANLTWRMPHLDRGLDVLAVLLTLLGQQHCLMGPSPLWQLCLGRSGRGNRLGTLDPAQGADVRRVRETRDAAAALISTYKHAGLFISVR